MGPAAFLGESGEPAAELDDGWRCWVRGEVDPFWLRRELPGFLTMDVEDVAGRRWAAPVVLNAAAGRAFRVSYGRDFLPRLSPAQQKLVEVATVAREELPLILQRGDGDAGMQRACAWAAVGLSAANHVTAEVLGALGLLDDSLVVETLMAMTSFSLPLPAGGQDA